MSPDSPADDGAPRDDLAPHDDGSPRGGGASPGGHVLRASGPSPDDGAPHEDNARHQVTAPPRATVRRRRARTRTGAEDLLGTYVPGRSPLHRSPLWLKAALVLGACLAVMLARDWRLSAGMLVLSAAVSAACGLGLRRWARSLRPLLLLVVLLTAYHLVATGPARAADVVLSLLAVVTLTRLLLSTTPLPRLVDGLVWLCTPLRHVGVDPERIGLAVSLMIRSVPWLFGVVSGLRDAAAARTVRAGPVQLVTPAVIATVDYAHRTGEALAARGLE